MPLRVNLFPINEQSGTIIRRNNERDFAGFLRGIYRLKARREIVQIYSRHKYGVAPITKVQRLTKMTDSHRFTFQFLIIPEGCLKAFLPIIRATIEVAKNSLCIYKITTFFIIYSSFGKFTFNALKDGDRFSRETVIVCPKHHGVIGIRPQHGNFTNRFTQRQDIILVSQQYHTLTCHLQSLGYMFF